ncbi:MAG: AAA family ATPase [Rhodospirillales bacterium]|nr:AAA family ATPase [Rhodospirillales bacterium]
MFQDHFGIDRNPFSNTPDPSFLFMSRRHQEALAHLMYGVQGSSGFVLLTGEVGTGKTTICRCLVERLPEDVDLALCLNPRLSEVELLANICDEMEIAVKGARHSLKNLTDAINAHLLDVHASGRRAVLLIDEAQNLRYQVLEQVRLLTNLETASTKLLQIILVGQPELKERLQRDDMRQLSQRITARYHLEPMTPREARDYIYHRLKVGGLPSDVFDFDAIEEISRLSGGIPRIINSICERSLLGAYGRGVRRIDRKLASRAAAEVLGGGESGRARSRMALPIAVGALIPVAVAALLALDPLEMNLVPALSRSPAMANLRAEIRTWPLIAPLFAGDRDHDGAASRDNAGTRP